MADDKQVTTPEPTAVERLARKLYKIEPPQRELYPASVAMRPAFESKANALSDAGVNIEAREGLEQETLEALTESGLDPYEFGAQLYNGYVSALLADARKPLSQEELSEQVRVDDQATRCRLREMYGAKDAEAWLARADKFVDEHPRLKQMLRARGLGLKPEITLGIVEHVRRVGWRPKS